MFTIGTLTLDDDPYISISYDYSQSNNGRIVGGTKKIILTGTIIEDSTSALITTTNTIKDWFAQSNNRYIDNVTINNVTYPFIFVDNVSIDSEDWVSSISYTINLVAQIESSAVLPNNILNIAYTDYLTGLDITETLELQSDKQNTYYLTNSGLTTIENSITWDIKISVTCRRSSTNTAIQNAHNILSQILLTTPDREEFNEYKSWTMYLQTRSLDNNPVNGSLSFSCRAILIPIEITIPALINITSSTNHNYISNSHSRNVNISCNGLVPITWSSIIDLSSFCISGKFTNAKSALDTLISFYRDNNNFPGQDINPNNLSCNVTCDLTSNNVCYVPKNITVNKNLTEGKATATLEWASDGNNCSNGLSIEVEKTENLTDKSIVENSNFGIVYPIITNLNCNKAIVWSYNINVSSKYSCPQSNLANAAWSEYNDIKDTLTQPTWYEIKKSSQETNNSYSISFDFVKACP